MRPIMSLALMTGLAASLAPAAALAGDAAAGEASFRQCASCHGIVDPDGNVTQRLAPTGPNLWGVIGRQAGAYDGYARFSDSLIEAGEAGLVWDEEHLVAYLDNQTGFLRDYLDNNRARSNMNHRLRGSAEDLHAYLATFSPDAD